MNIVKPIILPHIPTPESELRRVEDVLLNESLHKGIDITLGKAKVSGLGVVENVEAAITGRFTKAGDRYVVTDLGAINVTDLIRRIREGA